MAGDAQQLRVQQLRAYVEYFRDLGVHEFYRRGEPVEQGFRVDTAAEESAAAAATALLTVLNPAEPRAGTLGVASTVAVAVERPAAGAIAIVIADENTENDRSVEALGRAQAGINDMWPRGDDRLAPGARLAALQQLRAEIGDCTRCPLAYAGRHKVVFGDGDPAARLMFVGEGPGADEDEQGRPFVGKAGQLLNNMIQAMGLKREQVYIANIVMCRPPANRVPEPVEAGTCVPFLARQIDIVQPEVIVALGTTAATYLLGVKQSLASLRGTWHEARGAKVAVTYHPAFLLRDPRQKGEAWKDLQRVMGELGLKAPGKG